MWKHLHEVLDKLSALGLVINKKAQKGEEQGSSLVNARVSRPEAGDTDASLPVAHLRGLRSGPDTEVAGPDPTVRTAPLSAPHV